MDKEELYIWLDNIENLNRNLLISLINLFKSIDNLFMVSMDKNKFKNFLIDSKIYIPYKTFLSLTSFKIKEKAKEDYSHIFNSNFKISIIPIFSKNYPKGLLNLYNPPNFIYFFGKLNLNDDAKKIMILSLIDFSKYGECVLNRLISNSKEKNYVYISKLNSNNLGFLTQIGVECLYNLKEINEYLIQNKKTEKDNIIFVRSKYPNCSKVYALEIMSAISEKLLVIEAEYSHINLEIVNCFLEQGKEIYCVPGNILSPKSYLSNKLIYEGANVVISLKDF